MEVPRKLPAPTPEELVEGNRAIGEAAALKAGVDLSDRKRLNEFNALLRSESKERHLHNVTLCGIWVAGCAVAAMFVVLVLHYVLPPGARFLDAADVQQLQTFLFSGVIGGLLTRVAERVLPKDEERED